MATWSLAVNLDGADVSARLIGQVTVEAEESTARIGTFSMLPQSGTIEAGDWIGAPVQIDYIDNPGGSQVVTRLFTGHVNRAKYDPVSGFVVFSCTDNLQGHFEAQTEAQILAAIAGGKYSTAVFGDREDGWQQSQDVLSTVAKGYDLDKDGVTAALTDWAAKTTPDYSYTESEIIDKSVELELIRLRDLVNKVVVSSEYRFTRLHHRIHSFSWSAKIGLNGGFDFCDYFVDSYQLPTRDMIQGAAEGAGWAVRNNRINFETLPDSGTYTCGGGPAVWVISEENQDLLAVNASWFAVKRWSQTISETYTITVQEAGSVLQHGELTYEDGAGHQTDFDDSGWDGDAETETPAGWTQNAIGDYTEDQVLRVDSDNLLLTLLQIADVKIKESHRQNFVSWETAIEPAIERSHTAQMSGATIAAKGKVFHYLHTIDINTGSATTAMKIAVSKSWPGGSSDPLTVPAAPDTQPVHAAPSDSTTLDNRIGNDDTVANFDENWTGFTGNYSVAHGTPAPEQIYPRRFRLTTSDIEDESRQEIEAEVLPVYNVLCPDETLTITVP